VFRASWLVATVGFMVGCGASTPSPTEPSPAPPPSALSISADRAVLLVGDSVQLRALVTYSDGSVIEATTTTSWKSSDEAVCGVLPNGMVTALSAGRATITATWRSLSTSIALTAENSIRGRVMDFRTETGVAGVVVQFTGQSQDTRATTDANGAYIMSMPNTGSFTVSLDGKFAGTARVTGITYRGDLVVESGTCVSRYGTLADARTLKAVVGATVSVAGGTTTSGPDGWYRIDLGCPSTTGPSSFNTTFLYVTHPNYARRSLVVGRGVQGVRRLDLDLEPS